MSDDLDQYKNPRGQWAGQDQWCCPECPFDSLDRAAFRQHLAQHAPQLKIVTTGLVGADGQPIEKAVLDTGDVETRKEA